jgi:hypothetical protein
MPDDNSEEEIYIGSDGELSGDFPIEPVEDVFSSQDEKEKPKNTRNRRINNKLIALLFLIFVGGILLLQSFLPTKTSWVPVIQEFNGVEMVLVPAGCFMMGSTEDEIAELTSTRLYPYSGRKKVGDVS